MNRVRLMSYNVHGCVGLDGRRRVDRVARILRERDPDVVGLQEVDGRRGLAQIDALARATGLTPVWGPTIQTERGDYGNALLTRLEVLSIERSDISLGDREPRGLLDVRLRIDDARLRVVVTHLGLARSEREVQIEALLRRVAWGAQTVTPPPPCSAT